MYKVAEVINDFGTAFYLALIASFGYFVKWLIKKISNLVGKEFKNSVEEIVNEKNKPILDLAHDNKEKLNDLENSQKDIYKKIREVNHSVKDNSNQGLMNQILDTLQEINKNNLNKKNDK